MIQSKINLKILMLKNKHYDLRNSFCKFKGNTFEHYKNYHAIIYDVQYFLDA